LGLVLRVQKTRDLCSKCQVPLILAPGVWSSLGIQDSVLARIIKLHLDQVCTNILQKQKGIEIEMWYWVGGWGDGGWDGMGWDGPGWDGMGWDKGTWSEP